MRSLDGRDRTGNDSLAERALHQPPGNPPSNQRQTLLHSRFYWLSVRRRNGLDGIVIVWDTDTGEILRVEALEKAFPISSSTVSAGISTFSSRTSLSISLTSSGVIILVLPPNEPLTASFTRWLITLINS